MRSLNGTRLWKQLIVELEKFKTDIAAIQETRSNWLPGFGIDDYRSFQSPAVSGKVG